MPTENKKLRVVIDTNVFISGLNFAGKPSEVLELLIKGEIEVCISPLILAGIGTQIVSKK
jgi:putative PIN family toxin of toxin-antitoxin system